MRAVVGLLVISLSACAPPPDRTGSLPTSSRDLCYAASDNAPTAIEHKQAAARIVHERGLTCDWAALARRHAQEARSAKAGDSDEKATAAPPIAAPATTASITPKPAQHAKTQTFLFNGQPTTCVTVDGSTSCH